MDKNKLLSTAVILVAISLFFNLNPRGLVGNVLGAGTPTVILLCSQPGGGSSCAVGSPVPVGAGVVVVMAQEMGGPPAVTVNDGHGNLYTQGAGIGNAPDNLSIEVMQSKLTAALNTGDTIALSQNMTFNAYAVSNYTAPDVSSTYSTQGSTTSWVLGPTTNTASADVCLAGIMVVPAATASAGSGWTLLNQTNNADNRILAVANQLTSSGVAVGGTAAITTASGVAGVGIIQCYSYSSVDTTPPTVPTNLSATAVSSSAVNLSWTASTDNVGVTGYTIYRNGSLLTTVNYPLTTFSDTGLTAGATYTYTVDAYDAAGNHSSQSTSASATTQAAGDTTPPSTPTNLTATAISSSQINLSWTASTDNVGVTGYKIYRNGSQVGTSVNNNYNDNGLSPSTSYTYTVSAYDAAGNNSSQSTSASATTQSGSIGNGSNIYIAQSAAGTANGADCADALAASYFNTSSNWASSPASGKIGPGTTVHLCGTFTGTAGQTGLAFQGSGTSGNPITLLFEPNAQMAAPYWGGNPFSVTAGAITCSNSLSWITVDGGSNGVIQNTANGTGLAYSQPSTGVDFNGCSHYEIKNLAIKNIYVHTQDDAGGSNTVGIYLNSYSGSGDFASVHNNTVTEAYHGIVFGWYGTNGITSANIYSNNINYACHMMNLGDGNGNSFAGGVNIYNNALGPNQMPWVMSGQACHLDGIIINSYNNGSMASNFNVYNNQILSDMCSSTTDANMNCTGLLYFSGDFTNVNVFNNVLQATKPTDGFEGLMVLRPSDSYPGSTVSNFNIVNNSFIGDDVSNGFGGDAAGIKMTGAVLNMLANNNVFIHINPETGNYGDVFSNGSGSFDAVFGANIDHNDYFDATNFGADVNQTYNSWPLWQSPQTVGSFPGYDKNGAYGDPKLSASFQPQSGSAVIGLGANLTSLGITALDSDAAGVARPASGAWDAGAYQYSSSGSGGDTTPPAPPTGVMVN